MPHPNPAPLSLRHCFVKETPEGPDTARRLRPVIPLQTTGLARVAAAYCRCGFGSTFPESAATLCNLLFACKSAQASIEDRFVQERYSMRASIVRSTHPTGCRS